LPHLGRRHFRAFPPGRVSILAELLLAAVCSAATVFPKFASLEVSARTASRDPVTDLEISLVCPARLPRFDLRGVGLDVLSASSGLFECGARDQPSLRLRVFRKTRTRRHWRLSGNVSERPRHRDADAQPARPRRRCAEGCFRVPGLGGTTRAAQPDGAAHRPRSVAATASVRMGMRGGRKGVAFPHHRSGSPADRSPRACLALEACER